MENLKLVKLIIVFSVMGALISGCASVSTVSPSAERIDYPERNTITTANIGDTIVAKGIRFTYPAIGLASSLSKAPGLTIGYEIPVQKLPAAYETEKHTYYQASRMIQKDLLYPDRLIPGGLCVSKSDPNEIKVYVSVGQCSLTPKPKPVFQSTTVTAELAPSFEQQLIYNGRVDNFVKFLYREFSQDKARPAFSQDVQYDLNDGAEIGFKNARIEIVSASNTELRYRVLETFPDSD